MDAVESDLFEGGHAVYAPRRAARPAADLPGRCPFCPGGSDRVPLPYDSVLVIPNRYPTFPLADGRGVQALLLYTSDHDERLYDQPAERLAQLLARLGQLEEQWYARADIRVLHAFEIAGSLFGATVAHPHVQAFGLPMVPARLVAPQDTACPLCSFDPEWAIHEDSTAVVACLPGAKYGYQMTIFPRRHAVGIADLADDERHGVAQMLSLGARIAREVAQPYDQPPYMVNFFPSINGACSHFRIELSPGLERDNRVKTAGALELVCGVHINSVPRADARKALADAAMSVLSRPGAHSAY